jgi:hypothetical protein
MKYYKNKNILTITKVVLQLTRIGYNNNFIRKVILLIFGKWKDNKQINRIKRENM